ncbi:MAG: FAD-dependent oxidoreductase [Pseudodesulfovibrio sp.]|uniref:FAD-dependent pyridine nucleotide-disulfide oxidoreductase n=1 Tax=Pseudodesulfovibrio aespoeensis (strain ATCC 700646 / DSM 10631 / Aspo-2) TaxID=643562 RepID=E6VRN0_PSEA9|nr:MULTISPECIES: FAD-dependent oxidoreductase [Pseudodesulfovibrio]MBU4243850.1 FAD-dependent oxidoreductase [Pseudomonadota bacterium]ADU63067.1 FAD-dependent pyridine nucleotide-disulfide oxidoreductase [Pseudodesulfovibrio aespoeensis Aspo-2]MBU4378386.1 FAD-dependent oxidoreductase [Pseudomonadota bacterium]MBU4474157.1 FAD-dependent oxidoreductase [Pseudomonadota bacterium]MBU4517702.1 FAD-dependent oxidoreductase [Pseudomonadota bacterium]
MSQHIVVIGGVALGPKAACRFKRLEPGSKVTMIDQSALISYGGCGIPYYVSGEVSEARELSTTSFHMVRDVEFFKEVKGVDVRTLTRATRIDRENKQVHIQDVTSGVTSVLDYDKLVIATGATPRRLNLPGEDLAGVSSVCNPDDATRIREGISKGEVGKAVIIGAGFIGLEMAEAFADMWGVETSVVEITGQLMPRLVSPALAAMARKHMEENGVEFYFGESVKAIEGEDGRVTRVVTDKRTLEADAVIIAAGVVPISDLARDAGLAVHDRGGVFVDEFMRTSDPDIYAGGDCAIVKHLITGQPVFLPLGSMANRQGRVIGTNLAGGDARFDGVVGSFVVKLFETSLAGTGLSLEAALAAGFDAVSVLLVQLDRAHFYPTKELMTLEMIVEKTTRRVLGVQGFGSSGDAMVGRINAVAAILRHQPTVDDISNLEMAYAPPFASAMDVLNSLANLADNVLLGINRGVGPDGFAELWDQRDNGSCYFLDCREEADAGEYLARNPGQWHNIPQGKLRERLAEVPRDRPVVLVCNTGARSYEAQIILDEQGFGNVVNVQGGMAAIRKYGIDL